MCSTMCGVERNSMHPMFITCNKRTVALKWAKEHDTIKVWSDLGKMKISEKYASGP